MRELYPLTGTFNASTDSNVSTDPDDLVRRTYDAPGPLVRWNMISTLDGSGVGPDGVTGSINDAADHRVFGYLRGWADAVIVGAATVRAEKYVALRPNRWRELRQSRSPAPLLVVVSRSAVPPPTVAGATEDRVLLVHGNPIAPTEVIERVRALGHERILLEGGPTLAAQFVAAGLVDELCLTIVPTLVGGVGTRITSGAQISESAQLRSLLEEDGTLLGRWAI